MDRSTLSTTPAAPQTAPEPVPAAIRLLRRLQPVVVALLRSPLHPLLSGDVLLLTYVGPKTGRAHTLPLSYVARDGALYLCTRPAGSRWWRRMRAARPVELLLRGRRVAATPTLVDPASSEALEALCAFVTRNPRTGVNLYAVSRTADGRPSEPDLRRAVAESVVVRLDPSAA